MASSPVVIVGAGHAGVQAAASLREGGYDGAIVLLSDEKELPYQRPPLSHIPIQVIDPRKPTVGFIHPFGVNLYSLLFQAVE